MGEQGGGVLQGIIMAKLNRALQQCGVNLSSAYH